MHSEILEAISTFLGISIGVLPENGGTVMELSPSSLPRKFLGRDAYGEISVLILSKDKSQLKALKNVENTCTKADTLNLPKTEKWQIKTIEVSTTPNYVGQEKNQNGIMWIYSCMLKINYYQK